jgi:tight adherence protein C
MFLTLSMVFGCIALGMLLMGVSLVLDRKRLHERMEAVLSSVGPVDGALVDSVVDHTRARIMRVLWPITEPLSNMLPASMRAAVRQKLAAAGMLRYIDGVEFICLRILSAIIGAVLALGMYAWLNWTAPSLALWGALLVFMMGVLLPDYWIQGLINERQRKIRKMLPDVLDLLVVSVEAGTGFDSALDRVEEKFHGPVADEFGRVLQEMRLGKARTAALRDLAQRTGMPEVSTIVSAICQADQLGVSMAQVLRVQAQTLRQRRVYQIREMAQKLPVKLLFPLILCIFPAIFVVIVGAAMVNVYYTLMR